MDPNAALGISADFDAEGFRNAIAFAMQMGTTPDPDKRPKFMRKVGGFTYWKNGVQLGSTPRLDRDGKPLDSLVDVRRAPDEEILKSPLVAGGPNQPVDAAIEMERADAEELPVGNFRPTKLVVTLLDEDYEYVKDCRLLIYNGDRYQFGYEPETNGLFSVGVNTMIFYGLDDT